VSKLLSHKNKNAGMERAHEHPQAPAQLSDLPFWGPDGQCCMVADHQVGVEVLCPDYWCSMSGWLSEY